MRCGSMRNTSELQRDDPGSNPGQEHLPIIPDHKNIRCAHEIATERRSRLAPAVLRQ